MNERHRVSATEFAESHYKTPALVLHSIRCGKPNCKCRGDYRHGPYAYLYWRDGLGASHRVYVRKSELAAVREIIELRQAIDRDRRRLLAQSRDYLSFLNAIARQYRL